MSSCLHCGTDVPRQKSGDDRFCCQGCQYVYGMIHDQGLDRYYDLKDGPVAPVRPGILEKRDYRWLETAVAQAEEGNPAEARIDLDLEGISCIGCVWLLEKIFQRYPGGNYIEINPQLGQLRAFWKPGRFPWLDFAREIQRFGYLLTPAGDSGHRPETHFLTARLGMCAAFAMNAMVFTLPRYLGMEPDFEMARLFHWLTLLFATLSMAVGGSYFIQRSIEGLRHGILHIDFPIALGVTLAYIGSLYGWIREWESFIYFDFVSVFTFLMLVGRWVQEKALEYNRRRLFSHSRRPRITERLINASGEIQRIPLEKIEPGQSLRIAPGEVVPVGSRLLSEAASCSLEWINGESESRVFRGQQIIPGGAVNIGQDPIIIDTRESWNDSLLSRLLQENQTQPRSPLFEKVLRVYLVVVLIVAALGGIFWAWGPPADSVAALQVVLSVLVVSCPCALGVAAPLAHEWGVLRLRQYGLFVREASLFSRLDNIRKIVFDKTGTLTLETPVCKNPEILNGLKDEAREALRKITEKSGHPYSRSLRQQLWQFPAPAQTPQPDFIVEEVIGKGLQSSDKTWRLGKMNWALDEGALDGKIEGDCFLSHHGKLVAAFRFEEAVRQQARSAMRSLRRKFSVYILSGDQTGKVSAMAETLGIDPQNALGQQDPQLKADWIQAHQPESVLFIGDGANDSLAFDSAGVRGSPVVERGILDSKADFFFCGSGLNGILSLFSVAKMRAKAARRVFGFSISYNIGVGIVALMGMMNPLLAAILMPLSSVVTIALVAGSFRFHRKKSG